MLTKADIEQLKTFLATKEDIKSVREEIATSRQELESIFEKKLKPIRKDVRYLRKTVGIIVNNYDEADVKLDRRVTRIEQHLGL